MLAPANSDLESSDESRPGYHPVEVHTQAGPTQISLHNQAVEALLTGAWKLERDTRLDKRCVSIAIQGRTQGGLATPPYYGGYAISVLIEWKGSDVTPYAKRPLTGQRERIVEIPFSNNGRAWEGLLQRLLEQHWISGITG